MFIAEGPKIIEEALSNPVVNVKKVFAIEEWVNENKKYSHLSEVITVSETDLERISQLKTPHQVLAIIETPWSEGFEIDNERIALALDGIQDPGNMGTILRIADWFGIKQMICSKDCADIYNSKVVQASMGSIFRTEVFYTDLSEWLGMLQNTIIYGAALDGIPLKSYKNIQQGILVIGNEGRGIRPEVMRHVSQKITIERIGEAESLNAAVATGIILSHIAHP